MAKNFPFYFFGTLLLQLWPNVYTSDWKPIVPPSADYYAIFPCRGSDCGLEHKYHHRHDSPPEKEERKSAETPLATYQDVFRKTPSNFFGYKTSGKPFKTYQYDDSSFLRYELPDEVKFIGGPNYEGDYKIVINPSQDGDLKLYHHHFLKAKNPYGEQCPVYKVSFRQNFFNQYVQYRVRMPDLIEFTICLWFKFHNQSYEQSLLSYAAKPLGKDVYMWVSNLNKPGHFNMNVLGHTIFRLNYPFELHKWYHTCQSWNGNLGEWQVWVDGHRIGRGFHNSLVGRKIPGRGIAISGQVDRHFGKDIGELPDFARATGGLDGEITMLHMYKVALTTGKAYNDHTHHHSHHASTTLPPPEESEQSEEEKPPSSEHPLLENGQLKPHVNILELVKALKSKKFLDTFEDDNHHDHHQDFDKFTKHHHAYLPFTYSNHFFPNLGTSGEIVHYAFPAETFDGGDHTVFKRNDASNYNVAAQNSTKSETNQTTADSPKSSGNDAGSERSEKVKVLSAESRQVRVEKVKFPIDRGGNKTEETIRGSRNETDSSETESKSVEVEEGRSKESPKTGRTKRDRTGSKIVIYTRGEVKLGRRGQEEGIRRDTRKSGEKEKGKPSRRYATGDSERFYHSDLTGMYSPSQGNDFYELSAQRGEGGGEGFYGEGLGEGDVKPFPDPGNESKEIELAEDEVRRIMFMCSGCQTDPFRKVAVISWRSTPKKFYSGALFLKANPECQNF